MKECNIYIEKLMVFANLLQASLIFVYWHSVAWEWMAFGEDTFSNVFSLKRYLVFYAMKCVPSGLYCN